jgi:hypothetical protein
MSDQPPVPPSEPTPPPQQFAQYPRGNDVYGSSEKLQNLMDGYFGLNWVFLVNVVLSLISRGLGAVAKNPEQALVMLLGFVVVVFAVIAGMSYPQNKKIGIGMGWPPANSVIASILMGLNSVVCCGIIGFIVMQSIAANEMKRYGITGGIFGLKKSVIQAKIAELQAMGR